MLSYPIDEAEELLASKLAAAKQSLTNCEEDLDFLREQITVSIHGPRHTLEIVSDDVLDYGGCYCTSL
jgi:flagellar biosynthesis/type III secretory pathway protein FliH